MLRMGLRLRRERSERSVMESTWSERACWHGCRDIHTSASDFTAWLNMSDEEIGIAAEFGFSFYLQVTG